MFDSIFNPAGRELDMVNLAMLVFLPAAFAASLLLIPNRFKELMRWWALIGTAATLTLGLCRLIDYYTILDSYSDRTTTNLYHPDSRLDSRSDQAMSDAAHLPMPKKIRSDDLVTRRPWITRLDIDFALGVDGINLSLVLLTCVIMLLAVVASWKIEENLQGYLMLLLFLQTGVIGAFLALDLFLFFVFYEVMLMPMFFLIGLWGGKRRKYAAIKFVIYTLVGSVCLLSAIIALYSVNVRDFVDQGVVTSRAADLRQANPQLSPEIAKQQVEVHTFDFITLSKAGRAAMLVLNGHEDRLTVRKTATDTPMPTDDTRAVPLFAAGVDRDAALARLKAQSICTPEFQYILFALLFIGFAIKVPLVPLHSWLPDAHVEAPTAVSMILAGVLLKLGGYGLIRFAYPICPWAANELSWYVGLLGVVSIVYGAFVALGQTDFKKLLAYSSISHMGYVVLGLASWSRSPDYWEWGVTGAMFQMLSHGVSSAGMFFIVGVIYDRAHHREIDLLGGLKQPMPLFCGVSVILFFASMALPGLCGFVGEFCVMMSAWNYSPTLAIPAILTTILTAGYLLWTWQRVFLGTNPATQTYPDATPREFTVLALLAILAIGLGVLPMLIFLWVDPSVQGWIDVLARLK